MNTCIQTLTHTYIHTIHRCILGEEKVADSGFVTGNYDDDDDDDDDE